MLQPPRVRRLSQLYLGLLLYGASDAMMLLAGFAIVPTLRRRRDIIT